MTNTKSTKRALLASVMAMLLCFTMLLGTTFAWFTDSVTSSGNKIVAGSLKVDLEVLGTDNTTWTSVKEDNAAIFNYTNWEPGYVQVKVLRVVNEGTLALKWKATLVSSNGLTDLANVIDVYVKEDVTAYPTDRAEIESWTHVGTLAEFVNTIETTTTGELEANTSESLGIAFKMQETAGNYYQNMELGDFDINILATQLTAEKDAFDSDYDKDATYPLTSNAELDEAIKAGETNITLASGTYIIPDSAAGKTLTIVGNSDTVVAVQDDGSYEGCDYSLLGSNVTFENITITLPSGNYRGWASMDATFNNCTINGMLTLYGDTVFNNCTFNISGDAYNIWTWGADKVEFNDCTFNTDGKSILVYNQSCDVYVNGCTFNDSTNGTGFTKSAIETGVDGAGTATYNIYITETTVNGFAENDVKVGYKNVVGNKNSMTNEYLNIVVDGNDVH